MKKQTSVRYSKAPTTSHNPSNASHPSTIDPEPDLARQPFKIQVTPPYRLVQARYGCMLVNPNDFYVGRAILEYGEYSELEAIFLRQLLFLPGKVVEVGANIGTHTIALAQAIAPQQREVEVFEPQPFVFQNLCANLALNGMTNVRAWPMACGAQTETVYFPLPNYTSLGNFGAVSMQTDSGEGRISVPCVRLDDILGSESVALMKVDVEGFELRTLQGAAGVLSRSRPVLYLENDRAENSRDLIEWLWSQNYRLWWHVTPLFNPDNFFGEKNNIYGKVESLNMLGLPSELEVPVNGLVEIIDSTYHPLA